MLTTLRCTCCNAEITAPQFYNGNPYGYTCIKRVDPTMKRTKTRFLPVEYKQPNQPNTLRQKVKIVYNGKSAWIIVYLDVTKNTLGKGDMSTAVINSRVGYYQGETLFISEEILKRERLI